MENEKKIFFEIQEYLFLQFFIPKEKINLNSNLKQDLGLSSLALIQVLADFEEKYKISIDDEDIYNLIFVKDIVYYINRRIERSTK